MKKIIVIGCPGSGKSYFSKILSEKLNIKKYHLDVLYWKENWTPTPREEFIEIIKNILKEDSFIIDGNYSSSLEIRFEKADTIFFLDMPTELCLASEKQRRGKKREDLPAYLEEVGEDKEFIELIKSFSSNGRLKILSLIEKYSTKNIIIFKTRKEVDNYLENIK